VKGSKVSAATAAVIRTGVVVSAVSAAVVLVGGSLAWLLDRHAAGSRFGSWGDSLWWALTTLTTVGYGDHVPVTTAGRLVGAAVMIAGVAVLDGVAAGVALIVARAVAVAEEQALEAEAESLEARLESRLAALDARLARIEEQLHAFDHTRSGELCERDRTDHSCCGRC
jgi:voltage-gated potassium channel